MASFFFFLHTLICSATVFYECSVHSAEIPCCVQNQTEACLLVTPTIQKSCLLNCCILHIISHGFTHSLPPPCDAGLHGECMLKLPVGLRKEHTGVRLADEVFVCCPADAFEVLLLVWALQRQRCLHFRPQETQIRGQHVDENLQKMDHNGSSYDIKMEFPFGSNVKPFNRPLLIVSINFPIITKCLIIAVS